jgi:hypothetical protein
MRRDMLRGSEGLLTVPKTLRSTAMSLTKHESDLHAHLDRKELRHDKGVHTVTHPEHHHGDHPHEHPEGYVAPFGEIVLDEEAPVVVHHEKKILDI